MHITIAIPTFNRFEQLKRCVQSIQSQSIDDEIRVSIAISNTASSDNTYAYLSTLKEAGGNFFITNEIGADTQRNLGSLANTIPPDSDWVWLMGDDDYLVSKHSISIVHEIIQKSDTEDLSFVHACQARRSAQSEKMFTNSVLGLCEEFGYHEMLGWFSSIIMRKEYMVPGLINTQERFRLGGLETSAFTHSSEFLKLVFDKPGIFVDYPLVEPQDNDMSDETVQRWLNENICERYFYVVDDIIKMREQGIFCERLASTFFRYHTYGLWDRLITHQLNLLVRFKSIKDDAIKHAFLQNFDANWHRIQTLCGLVRETQVRKYLQLSKDNAMSLAQKFLEGKLSQRDFEYAVNEQTTKFNAPAYDFGILQQEHNELVSAA